MAVPKKKSSASRRGKRRAGQTHKLSAKTVTTCPDSGEWALPHRVSPGGFYKGKKVFATKADKQASQEESAE